MDRKWSVVVSNRFRPEVVRQWRTPVRGIRPGGELELTFRNDLAIEADVRPAGKLPEGVQLATLLYMDGIYMVGPTHGRLEQADAQLVASTGGVVRFEHLADGRYLVRLFAANNESLGWERPVDLAGDGKDVVAKVAFPLPRLETGAAKLRVVDEAGQPVRDAKGNWYGLAASSGEFKVRDGVAEISGVLAAPSRSTSNRERTAAR